jgi:type IV pilus assembly protein PilV
MSPRKQQGVVLLEALVAILIFSIGILAIVGMQAQAVSTVTESRSRSEASFLANQLITQIWTDATNADEYAWDGTGAAPARMARWWNDVNGRLPGANDKKPIVTISDATSNGATVQVQMFWRMPDDPATDADGNPYAHEYIVRASIFTDN